VKKKGVAKYPEFVAVRLGTDMRRALEKIAEAEDRAIGYVIRRILQEWIDSREAEPAREKKAAKKKKPGGSRL
jgi:predicted transcriptional regulator